MLNNVCVFTIKVNNLKEAVQFYTTKLDFEVSKYYGEKIASLVHNGIPIVLEEKEVIDTPTGNNVIIGLLSTNIQNDFEHLKEKGVIVLFEEPKPCLPGQYFVIEDIDGNKIEVVEFSN